MTFNEIIIGHIAGNVLGAKHTKVIKKLSGGLTNVSYLVAVDEQLYVFRLAGKDTNKIIQKIIVSILLILGVILVNL